MYNWIRALCLLSLVSAVSGCIYHPPTLDELRANADWVGRENCISCHQEEYDLWVGSDHDLAMQPATDSTVIGDFDDASITRFGRTSRFYRRDGKFFMWTDNAEGEMQEFEISYTFGYWPLQQYLVIMPDGRYQATSLCWDDNPAEEGGQRWFHLYPDEPIPHDDPLHWTGSYQNWNYMCAECHSTNLKKGFDLATNTYNTTWDEIDVSCEACHGPGSEHVVWAEEGEEKGWYDDDPRMGLLVDLGNPDGGVWIMDQETGTATRSKQLRSRMQIESCARCHSRRGVIRDPYEYGNKLLDSHRPQLLEPELYYADGQILDEVYVYGSFLQSTMYEAGVICTDCHEAHSYKPLVDDNALCGTCHLPSMYDTEEHHFHEPGTEGSLCVDCHMPTRNYMVVDPRRDHSMRIPRPDLTEETGSPDVCSRCHDDQPLSWSVAWVEEWYGPDRRQEKRYGQVLRKARDGVPEGEEELITMIQTDSVPAIVRATGLNHLRTYPSRAIVAPIRRSLADPSPLVRMSALATLDMFEPGERLSLAYPLLDDPTRAVRLEASRVLAGTQSSVLNDDQRTRLQAAIAEYERSIRVNEDRPEAHLQLGVLFAGRGRLTKAEEAYRTALRLNPRFTQTYVNLADLHRMQGRDGLGEAVLRDAIEITPGVAEVHHALGLLLARSGRNEEALAELRRASVLEPVVTRFAYVYAIALNAAGQSRTAITVLEDAFRNSPTDLDVLTALVTINRDQGNRNAALRYARELQNLRGDDPSIANLVRELETATSP